MKFAKRREKYARESVEGWQDGHREECCQDRHASWMTDLPHHVKQLPLSKLTIPGSHDSGTSNLVPSTVAGVDQPKHIRDLVRRFPRIAKFLMPRWSVTQHLDVTKQLQQGIRYLDIRCVAVREENRLRVIHCLLGDTIRNILLKIKYFLHMHPQEVVILDFQHVYNFVFEDHVELCRALITGFGAALCPRPPKDQAVYSLQFMQDSGFQVIVIYPVELAQFCWTRELCPSPWPNTTSPAFLKDFLTKNTSARDPNRLFVSQGIFTPRPATVIFHPVSTLETACAKPCNATVKSWLQQHQTKPSNQCKSEEEVVQNSSSQHHQIQQQRIHHQNEQQQNLGQTKQHKLQLNIRKTQQEALPLKQQKSQRRQQQDQQLLTQQQDQQLKQQEDQQLTRQQDHHLTQQQDQQLTQQEGQQQAQQQDPQLTQQKEQQLTLQQDEEPQPQKQENHPTQQKDQQQAQQQEQQKSQHDNQIQLNNQEPKQLQVQEIQKLDPLPTQEANLQLTQQMHSTETQQQQNQKEIQQQRREMQQHDQQRTQPKPNIVITDFVMCSQTSIDIIDILINMNY
eukprot:TRINITY_DN1601_c0_g1_i6.p1 TRINITY_DN1601_c0_g1~~TRINITY_DN1601_c0_g1_i6.p1  ORF type:complete len:566 (+),score=118.82 TRINITY_DN1601_c0_g1_i6:59-1756(+)